jgi:hypothetical protein
MSRRPRKQRELYGLAAEILRRSREFRQLPRRKIGGAKPRRRTWSLETCILVSLRPLAKGWNSLSERLLPDEAPPPK